MYLLLNSAFNFFSCIVLCVWVLAKCPKKDVGLAFTVMTALIAVWSFCYFFWQISPTPDNALFPFKGLTTIGIWINQAFLYFVFTFLGWTKIRHRLFLGAAALNILFTIQNQAGFFYPLPLISWNEWGFWPRANGWCLTYVLFWHVELVVGFSLMWKNLNKAHGLRKEQIKYILTAFGFGYTGGVFNWPLWFGVNVPPLFNWFISLYLTFIAYAIIKDQLIKLNIIVRTTFIYSVLSACLAAVYAGVIIVTTKLMEGWIGFTSIYSSAFAAVIVVVVSRPLQVRVQKWMDRRFPRESLGQTLLRETTGHFAHEIKRPLVKISMPAQLAISDVDLFVEKGLLTPAEVVPLKERLSFILNQSHEAADKIEAIRELSLEQELPKETVNLIEVLNTSLQREEEHIVKYGIQIEKSFESSVATIVGSAKQLEIALTNIIRNAIEAMHAISLERKLGCRVYTELNQYVIMISDTGHGIRPEDQGRLFHPWFSTKGSKGMGVGLYISHRIIRAHGGEIDLRSDSSRGTEFQITLPKTQSEQS